jgi:hypothetical protein
MGSAYVTASRTFVPLSNEDMRVLELSRVIVCSRRSLNLSRVVELLGVSILLEVRRSSSSCSPDWRSPSSGCVYCSRGWENYQVLWIMEVHRERSGQVPLSLLTCSFFLQYNSRKHEVSSVSFISNR